MPLYLVRHGKAHSGTIDPDRSLTVQGRVAVDRFARIASAYALPVSQILHSDKTRARQTAEIMAQYLKPSLGIKEIEGINPKDDVVKISKSLDSSKNIMLVGHLPFLEDLVSYLIIGQTDKTIIKLQAGGIACLDNDSETQGWYIKWALMPEME
jgi:phosphohistidine phosphatase